MICRVEVGLISMRYLSVQLSFILFLTTSLFGQSSDRPQSIVIPISSIGEVSETRKQILQNTLTQELSKHFQILPQDQFERVLEKVFEELEYDECTEDQCIVRIQEVLQIENVFNLQVIGEEGDTQLNLKWMNLDEKKNREDYCEGCKTKELRKRVRGLVDELVGWKKEGIEKPIVQKLEKDKTKGLFVSVGDSGTILTSEDGISWSQRNSGTSETLLDVIHGKENFVSVGGSGTILTSNDGYNWISRYSGTTNKLWGLTYGKGLFVTIGFLGRDILTSKDGISWTQRNSKTLNHMSGINNFFGITYGRGLFIILCNSGIILTSTDGISWSQRKYNDLTSVDRLTYINKLFIIGGRRLFTSNDGHKWLEKNLETSRTKKIKGLLGDYLKEGNSQDVSYGNNIFVSVGFLGTILNSFNGEIWKESNLTNDNDLWSITYGNGIFVTVGSYRTIYTSEDGKFWTERRRSEKSFQTLYKVTYN